MEHDDHASRPSPLAPHPHGPGVPRWPATIALIVLGTIFFLISARYPLGPRWSVPAVIAVLLVPVWITRRRGLHHITGMLVKLLLAAMTLAVIASATLLVVLIPVGGVTPRVLLRYSALIWIANVLTFALWYWDIDGGGPAHRHPGRHASSDFAFPQQQLDDDGLVEGWSPGFIDYLFLAFNTSTAFSPTDTIVLSRHAKLLMMLQSSISLVVIGILVARAINTLGN
ncbi:MAG: hypothetical protein U0232_08915 [Thermomicrobiales bacterium]